MKGYRKVLIFALALICFESTILVLKLTDAAAIIAVGSMVSFLLGGAIYGNIREHQTKKPE